MEFKCKICAGSLTIDPKTRIATCDYCGTKQILPMFGDDSSRILYERGNQYLLHNEYDKAEAIFNQLLSVNSNDAEIYWDLVLCRYGVTYARDPKTQEYIPTCNRTQTESVFKNENYKKAIELSTEDKAVLYKKDAEIIEKIQKGILELARKEKPFDIFISYKETDENGYRTKDSIEAQKLYDKLTELGYKVFFSRITLESKVGEEYEPIIYAALSSSKVMITICSSADYIRSAWVENEWSRFLVLRRGDMSKNLIPVYFDMDESELPEEFELLSSMNMKEDDFEQELVRGIKKIIPVSTEQITHGKKTRMALIIVTTIVAACTIIAVGWAKGWIGKKAQYKSLYEKASELYAAGNYDEAKRVFDELGEYENSAELAEKCIYQEDFLKAMDLYYDHQYAKATWALSRIGDYDEVNEALQKCKSAWRESLSTIALKSTEVYPIRGSYYIDNNGSVKTFTIDPGTANIVIKSNESGEIVGKDQMDRNEHGKIISIAENGNYLYALYEDGYVCNSAYLNRLDKDWENVVQITDEFNVTSAALLDDGTVVCGDTTSIDGPDSDEWLQGVSEWVNIEKLAWTHNGDILNSGEYSAIVIGIDDKGNVYSVMFQNDWEKQNNAEYYVHVSDFLNTLKEIKDIQITEEYITALDYGNTLHIYNTESGETFERIDIKGFWGEFYIDSKNNLKKYSSDNAILEGVVYLNNGYCVTQSGTIYTVDGKNTNEKTGICDAWLER